MWLGIARCSRCESIVDCCTTPAQLGRTPKPVILSVLRWTCHNAPSVGPYTRRLTAVRFGEGTSDVNAGDWTTANQRASRCASCSLRHSRCLGRIHECAVEV